MLLALRLPAALAMDSLENGGFEDGFFTGWEAWGEQTAVVEDAYEGAYAARFALDPTIEVFQQSGMYQDVAGAVPGERVQLTAVVRTPVEDPVTGGGELLLSWEGVEDGTQSGILTVPFAADGAWSGVKLDLVVPDGITTLRYVVLLNGEGAGSGGTVLVDDLRLDPYAEDLCADTLGDQPDDSDGDGLGDDCDLCDGDDTLGDEDGDGVCGDTSAECGCDTTSGPSGALLAGFGAVAMAVRRRRSVG